MSELLPDRKAIDMTKIPKPLHGVIPPMMTPLDKNENIDEAGTKRLIERCINGGVSGIFILGTMGEGQSLIDREKKKFIKISHDAVAGRVPLFAGVSAESHRKVMKNVENAIEAGADYIVVLPPYFFYASCRDEIIKYYKDIAKYSSIPLVIYNNPVMTGNKIDLDAFKELSEEKNIVGVKNSSGDFDFHMMLLREFENRNDFSVFSGVETMCDASMMMGSDGIVAGMASLTPEIFVALYNAAIAGDFKEAREIQKKLLEIMNGIYLDGYFAWQIGQKYALSLLGVCEPYHSTETRDLTAAEKLRIAETLKKFNIK
ncbi:MAG: dihydrodipicolinate synthase family protein [Oscillospiraceae bacterium]|nr:dihydrodipicolinate synthase family protein [Oscillospiraceae bacterium]